MIFNKESEFLFSQTELNQNDNVGCRGSDDGSENWIVDDKKSAASQRSGSLQNGHQFVPPHLNDWLFEFVFKLQRLKNDLLLDGIDGGKGFVAFLRCFAVPHDERGEDGGQRGKLSEVNVSCEARQDQGDQEVGYQDQN